VRLNQLFSAQDAILLDKQQMMIISLLPAANSAEAGSLPAPDFVKQPSSRGLPMYAIGGCILCVGRLVSNVLLPCRRGLSACAQWDSYATQVLLAREHEVPGSSDGTLAALHAFVRAIACACARSLALARVMCAHVRARGI
jgi:hypothetical protein